MYSPLRVEGIGLSDGEVMERLWSYLRRYSRITKEMRPAHRIDVLTHALLYYGITTKKKQGMYNCVSLSVLHVTMYQNAAKLIFQRWVRACEMKTVATQQLSSIIDTLQGNNVC